MECFRQIEYNTEDDPSSPTLLVSKKTTTEPLCLESTSIVRNEEEPASKRRPAYDIDENVEDFQQIGNGSYNVEDDRHRHSTPKISRVRATGSSCLEPSFIRSVEEPSLKRRAYDTSNLNFERATSSHRSLMEDVETKLQQPLPTMRGIANMLLKQQLFLSKLAAESACIRTGMEELKACVIRSNAKSFPPEEAPINPINDFSEYVKKGSQLQTDNNFRSNVVSCHNDIYCLNWGLFDLILLPSSYRPKTPAVRVKLRSLTSISRDPNRAISNCQCFVRTMPCFYAYQTPVASSPHFKLISHVYVPLSSLLSGFLLACYSHPC